MAAVSRWFRFYGEALDDPKVQRLPAPLFKVWVNLLCIASRHEGRLPPLPDLAFMLRASEASVGESLRALKAGGLVDDDENGSFPHNWDARQFQSDSSAERVRRHRNAKCNVTSTVTVTPPDTDTDTEQTSSLRSDVGASAPPKPKRAKPRCKLVDSGWTADIQAAIDIGLSSDQIDREIPKFIDYHAAKGSLMADWPAAWRTWCRNALRFLAKPASTQPGGTHLSGLQKFYARKKAELNEAEPRLRLIEGTQP